jgi:hypothetical protein
MEGRGTLVGGLIGSPGVGVRLRLREELRSRGASLYEFGSKSSNIGNGVQLRDAGVPGSELVRHSITDGVAFVC